VQREWNNGNFHHKTKERSLGGIRFGCGFKEQDGLHGEDEKFGGRWVPTIEGTERTKKKNSKGRGWVSRTRKKNIRLPTESIGKRLKKIGN